MAAVASADDVRHDAVIIGAGSAGIGLGSALALGGAGFVIGALTCEGRDVNRDGFCYNHQIGAEAGGALGLAGGLLGGAAGLSTLVDRRVAPVVGTGTGVLVAGAGIALIGIAADSDALVVSGALFGAVGAPIAIGIVATHVPPASVVSVRPRASRQSIGLDLVVAL